MPGIRRSGDTVPSTIESSSSGAMPASASACRDAVSQSDTSDSSRATRRSRMPVRSRIHSSEVSSVLDRSSLVTTVAGHRGAEPGDGDDRTEAHAPAAARWPNCALMCWSMCDSIACTATRMAFLIAFPLDDPWHMMETPFTPSSGAPPYSV